MRKILLSIVLFALIMPVSGLFGQQNKNWCATDHDGLMDRLTKNIEAIKNGKVQKRGAVIYIPVKYHLVANSSGEGRVDERNVLLAHCQLNSMYLDQEIQFYIKDGFNYIDNNNVYDDTPTASVFLNPQRDPSAVNVVWVKQPRSSGAEGITLGYYSPQRDWIIMRSTEASSSSQTLSHEMGHFFALAHPHLGWESDPFTSDDPTWPVATALSPGTILTEKADGSNCLDAADKLCDTPADYNGLYESTCNYQGGAKDPMGELINPDETLIMSYFQDMCTDKFTDDQKAVIVADLESSERDYLDNSFNPGTTDLGTNFTALYPQNNEIVALFTTNEIDWSDVDGATDYLFQISNRTGFLAAYTDTYWVNESRIELELEDKTNYFYRVLPMNGVNSCSNFFSRIRFTVNTDAVGVNEIESVSSFGVSPNPIRNNENLALSLNTSELFEGQVQIRSLTGQLINSISHTFVAGNNQVNIPLKNMSSGLYLVHIYSSLGTLNTKFVVSK